MKTTSKDTKKTTRGWPPARRKAQAARIRKQKPWTCSTGPKTESGKARISRNAYRHGFRSRDYNEICRLLRWQRDFMRSLLARHGTNKKCFYDLGFSEPNVVLSFRRASKELQ